MERLTKEEIKECTPLVIASQMGRVYGKTLTRRIMSELLEYKCAEEELGVDFITLCKILKYKECYDEENKDCYIVGITRDKVILMPKAFPYGECEFTRPFTELNKTWFLIREKMEK